MPRLYTLPVTHKTTPTNPILNQVNPVDTFKIHFNIISLSVVGSRDSAAGIATGYGLDDRGV
jgi:hypothetical protein